MIYSYQGALPGIPVEPREGRGVSRDVYHVYMTRGVVLDQLSGMPIMKPERQIPHRVVSFSEAMKSSNQDYDSYVHFYENDDQIMRFWNNPWNYLSKLSKYAGFIASDYSTGPTIPRPIRQYNVYRNQLVGAWLQSLGFHVLCNVRCPAFGHDYFLAGVPKNSVLAVGEVGCVKNRCDRKRFEGGLIRAVTELSPKGLVVVGKDSYDVFDIVRDAEIPLYFYDGQADLHFGGDV